ncbi:MAG: 16S rRNA (cytidine(1402)-2'-O)-methyltransferase [Alphaproteobacteria bacterium]|nr:16S rRNA (cytidine(1402)-2'-O)-methyltransferase [Alphaproteobacteria bacterium]
MLIPTPIGNLGDMTLRAIDALKAADTILCEDTRTSARLLSHFGVTGRTMALHEHNEDGRIAQVLAMLREGKRVALISDAGTPLVSDPGYRLVRAAIAEGLPVGGLPGANAALLALTLSGLPPHPFLFLGFPPPKGAARRAGFASLRAAEVAGLSATLIWYEAPHRLVETLEDLAAVLGPRAAAVGRELTKRFEEIRRGTLPDLAAGFIARPPRGEITIVVAPAGDAAPDDDDLDRRLRSALDGHRLKEAVAIVTAATGLPRKQVYARALALGSEGEGSASF